MKKKRSEGMEGFGSARIAGTTTGEDILMKEAPT